MELSLGLIYWIKGLPDTRPEYSGLKALMMGPFVMAGLTHDSRWLELDEASLGAAMSEPGDPEELLSLQVGGWGGGGVSVGREGNKVVSEGEAPLLLGRPVPPPQASLYSPHTSSSGMMPTMPTCHPWRTAATRSMQPSASSGAGTSNWTRHR